MGKRIALGAVTFVLWFAVFFAGKALIVSGFGHNRPFIFVFALVLLGAYYALARWVERRDPIEIAAGRFWLAALGAAIGLFLFGFVIVVFALFGFYHFVGFASVAPLAGAAIASFAAAIGEELLFRGFIFRWIEDGAGTWIALGISALVFGLAHGLNRGTSPIVMLAIAVEAGVLLSAAYVYSRSLWLPIGLHFGWDFAGGGLFGSPAVGKAASGVFAGAIVAGPDSLTGGRMGVEASSIAIAACLVVAVAFLVAAARAGQIKQPMWRRSSM